MNREDLSTLIVNSLKVQGFRIRGNQILPPAGLSKSDLRRLHLPAVQHRIEEANEELRRREEALLNRIACGAEVLPEAIQPRLVEVRADSEDELLFRYASLHWSVPVSSGYGRRLRFLVVDEQNEKLIGLIGLGDPVFSLSAREDWVGWDTQARRKRLHHVMDAFVLGAVPPYSFLLCGKLVGMLAASNEVRMAFKKKYGNRRSLIRRRKLDGRLALITTTSALGRSSVYNRLKYRDRLLYQSVGFTRGCGEFHFSDGLYGKISDYAARYCEPTAKEDLWGAGFRNRREVVRKCLVKIGLSADWLYHGIQREIFVVPLARNSREILRGEHSRLLWYDHPASGLFAWFRERWLLPRAERDQRYRQFIPSTYTLWRPIE